MNESDVLHPYLDSNPTRDEVKDDSPFRHTFMLAGCDPILASGLRLHYTMKAVMVL